MSGVGVDALIFGKQKRADGARDRKLLFIILCVLSLMSHDGCQMMGYLALCVVLSHIRLQVYSILDEFILSGEVEESSKREILERIRELEKLD